MQLTTLVTVRQAMIAGCMALVTPVVPSPTPNDYIRLRKWQGACVLNDAW